MRLTTENTKYTENHARQPGVSAHQELAPRFSITKNAMRRWQTE